MNKVKAIEFINSQLDAIPALKTVQESDMTYRTWKENTISIVKSLFGEDSSNYKRIYRHFYPVFWASGMDEHALYINRLDRISSLLNGMITEIDMLDDNDDNSVTDSMAIDIVANICNRFPKVVRQLKQRHAGRSTICINDEYDVQDLFHALLQLHFENIEAEAQAPNHAGGASRIDFLLNSEQIGIEIKHTREGLTAKKLGEELIVDIERYQSHPNCKTLICFVYDPEYRISNPLGIENHLTRETELLKVITIITPK